jgi:hypothetical protein
MSWTDEALMAYVDGELDDRERARLTLALTADVALRRRLKAMKQQRRRVEAAYAPVLDEPVPDRLANLLRAPAMAPAVPPAVPPASTLVVDLDEVRAASARRQRPASSWWQWGGMAAALAVGMLLGTQIDGQGSGAGLGLHDGGDGRLVAGGAIGQALSSQLASEPVPGAPVAVQLSFVDKGGSYCRTFSTAATAGLACRQAGPTGQAAQWAVQTLAAVEAVPAGAVRQAATALPPAVLEAVDKRIAGDALDPARERQARDEGWRR